MIWQTWGVLIELAMLVLLAIAYVKKLIDETLKVSIIDDKKKKVITLCGSTKFKDAYLYFNRRLSLDEDAVVISVSGFHHADKEYLSPEDKDQLNLIHLQKMDMADEIFIIDIGEYVGSHTQSEIEYATKKNMKIRYATVEFPETCEKWDYLADIAKVERDNAAKVN